MPRKKAEVPKTSLIHTGSADVIPAGANVLIAPQEGPQWDLMLLPWREILFGGAKGGGKAQPLSAKVLTPFGFRPMGDIKVGSVISNPDGGQTTVIGVYPQGKQKVYKITFADGACTRATADHLWLVKQSARKIKASRKCWPFELGEETDCKVWTTEGMIEILGKQRKRDEYGNGGPSILVPLTEPVSFSPGRRGSGALTPYVLGVLIGDGCIRTDVSFCSNDPEIPKEVEQELGITLVGKKMRGDTLLDYTLPRNPYWEELKKLELAGKYAYEKHIPESFKIRNVEDRFALLQGLMDTDGYISADGKCSYTSSSEQLAKDVQWVARSLGFKATITSAPSFYMLEDGEKKECRTAYTVYLQGQNMQRLCRLPRKRDRLPKSFNGGEGSNGITIPMRRIVSIEPDGEEICQCIAVDHPNRLYITDDFIVTHNTAGARIWALKGNPDEPQDILVNVSYVYHPGYRCLILRKNAQDMMDFIDKAKSMYEAAYGAIWSGDGYFEFPSGAKIVIGHMASEDAYMKYMGQEWTRIIVEEVTQIKSVMLYMRIISCARTVHSSMKVQILLTANPEGPGFHWVRTRFMTHPKTGKRVPPKTVIEEEVFNPFTNKKEVLTRYFLPSKISDNKILLANDPGYVTLLLGMPESLKKAYIDGDWDVLSGKYFHNFRKDGPLEGEPEWANHCVDSATVWHMPWYRKWCGLDVGFEHWMVCHWFFENEEDDRIYTYRTLRTRRMGMEAFGREWAKRSMEDFDHNSGSKAITIWMSHDAFHKRDSSPEAKDISMVARFEAGIRSVLGDKAVYLPTQEEMPNEPDFFERLELQKEIKVIIRKAPMHRQGSAEYVRELLEWKRPQLNADTYDNDYANRLLSQENGGEKYLVYLKAHLLASVDPKLPKVRIFLDKCPELIKGIEDAIYDEDRLNIMKVDCNTETGDGGDDDLQAFIYGLSGYQKGIKRPSNEPAEIQMQREVHRIASKYNYQLDGSQMAMIRWQAMQKAKKSKQVGGFKIPRRSSHWFNRKKEKPEWGGPLDGSLLQ